MQVEVSADGTITIPEEILASLGLKPGDLLDVAIEGERIVLTRIGATS